MSLYVSIWACKGIHVDVKDSARELLPSFYCLQPWYQTQGIRLTGKCLYPLSQPASPDRFLHCRNCLTLSLRGGQKGSADGNLFTSLSDSSWVSGRIHL